MTALSAVQREAAWLAAYNPADGLPPLLSSTGGRWDIVAAYLPRTPPTRQAAIYLVRASLEETRFANQRKRQSHGFRAYLFWPIGSSTTASGIWESEQLAFDLAVDDLVARIRGTLLDHTHGGQFMSVAEAPTGGRIGVRFVEPTASANTPAMLTADVTYSADSTDIVG